MGRRLLVEMMEERVLLSTITVNSSADTDIRDANLTLREAILVANGDLNVGTLSVQEQAQVNGAVNSGPTDPDQIHFAIPGAGAQTIAVTSALPNVTDSVVIDGTTQTGYAGTPLIRLLGTGAGANVNGLTLTADGSTVKGLAVVGFDGAGISLQGGENTVQGNYVGIDTDGLVLGNHQEGVVVTSSDNTIGGTTAGAGNLIAFNGGAGINIEPGDEPGPLPTGNSLFENIIYQNAGGAILSTVNATPSPTLTSVISTGGTTHIDGTVSGPSNATVRVEFFDPPFGAPVFLGATDVLLNSSGQGVINADFPITVPAGNPVLATSTAPGLNTSNFSEPLQVNTESFDLSVAQTVAPTIGSVGQNLTYTITVRNNFTDPVTGVVLTNTLPTGATLVSSSITPTTNVGGVLTFDLGDMAGEAIQTITVVVSPTLAGTATNAVSVLGVETDPDMSNNSASLDTTVNAVATADLAVTQSVAPTPGTVGQDLTYTITVTNNGPNDATGVVLTNTLQTGVTYVSSTPSATTIINGVLTFNLGNIANGADQTITVVVQPTASGTLTNLVSVAGVEADPNPNNNTSSLDTQVNPAVVTADLAVTQSVAPTTGTVGETLTYIISVTNNGPDDATGVVLTNTLSTGVVYVSSTPNATTNVNGVLTFDLGNLAFQATQTIILSVRPTVAGTITNAVAATSNGTDPNPNNNTSNLSTLINPAPPEDTADLAVTQSVLPIPGIVGQDLVYTIVVTNNGPETAIGAVLTNTLPAGTTFVSASEPGSGAPGPNLTFHLGDLAQNATRTIMIIVQPTQTGPVTNVAAVTSTTPDSNQGNNTSSLTTDVIMPSTQMVDLVLTLDTKPSPAVAGQYVYYIFTVTNNGPGIATGTVLTQTLPAGATFGGISGPADVANGVVTANLGDIAPGASVTFAVAVTPTAEGVLRSQATVTTTADDTSPENSTLNSVVVVNPATPVVAPVVTGLERFGVHNDPTHLVLTFSEPLDPATAENLNNYLVVDPGRDGRFNTRDDRALPIASATYDPTTQTVTLAMRNLLKLHGVHGLLVNGNPGGVTGQNGLLLDGDNDGTPGGDYVTAFGAEIWHGGTTTPVAIPVQAARRPLPPARHRVVVPRGPRVVLARPSIAQRPLRARALRRG